ncbi:hypothetical protein TcasGA2_TC003381 [Tribolium castaneum]|uniref:Uncharacterized protein n=1 Tax=Tribolium castaneum TaxID=7070 RepID=D6WG13_TRICA|nr:hypothetical protein TcasGA2_TC003381 [Tribolium castaneum]
MQPELQQELLLDKQLVPRQEQQQEPRHGWIWLAVQQEREEEGLHIQQMEAERQLEERLEQRQKSGKALADIKRKRLLSRRKERPSQRSKLRGQQRSKFVVGVEGPERQRRGPKEQRRQREATNFY